MFSQSFFSGVMRWGGTGIRLVSDFKVVFSAPGATRGKDGAVLDGTKDEGSVSIIKASSSASCVAVCVIGFERPFSALALASWA